MPGSFVTAGHVVKESSPTAAPRERQGLVFDKWPFRLDIPVEYQDWILVAVCMGLVSFACMPCFCGHMHNRWSRAFTHWVYTRLHVFFCFVMYFDLLVLMFTIGVLPDWTVNEFVQQAILFVTWVLVHLQKMIVSFTIIFGLSLMIRFRERLLLAAGMEHVTVIRWNWRDVFGLHTKKRPVEIFIWKVDGLHSSSKKLKPNDVYVECHMGHNEPMRTRVHNNAGSGCNIRESFQLNIDESAASTLMTLLVKDQSLVGSTELARLMLSTRELCGIEDQTGKRRVAFDYSEECFVSLDLSPSGKIWIAVSPVEDGEADERAPLMQDDSLFVTC
mmetsp:Transcript_47194/g.109138  ORF Transcript_47194/g.109138 Transcript_47194/m.109138 type:complete len:331 (-) Transcript_47194:159-1151(-)